MVLGYSLLWAYVAEHIQLLLVFSTHAFFLSGCAVETREFRGTPSPSKRVFPHPARVDSEVIAESDFRAPGKYIVEKRSGSSMGAQVVKRILGNEVGIAVSSQKSRSVAVTQENYLFSYLGEAVLDGQSYYLLRLAPRRKQPELISGQAWVDKQSFLIRRLEGTVKSPSMWVKNIHVRFDFDSPRGIWVLSNMEAVADVRFLGARKLTSHVMNYGAASVVAEKIGAVAPTASALLSK